MNEKQALAKARKLFGKSARVRADNAESSPERRERARTRLAELRASGATDPAARREMNECRRWAVYYRCSVGHSVLGVFSVQGQGDTFAEAFADMREGTR